MIFRLVYIKIDKKKQEMTSSEKQIEALRKLAQESEVCTTSVMRTSCCKIEITKGLAEDALIGPVSGFG